MASQPKYVHFCLYLLAQSTLRSKVEKLVVYLQVSSWNTTSLTFDAILEVT